MAVSEIIGAAVGVLLLIIVAYVVVGSTLFAAETVTTAQKDLTLLQEARLRTAFSITDQKNESTMIIANITNTGTEIIGDFKHMDVIVYDGTSGDYEICNYTTDAVTAGRWGINPNSEEFIHKMELDPGERYQIWIQPPVLITNPKWFQITTGNGVSASAFI
jgi:archaeal flagellar protein FlaF